MTTLESTIDRTSDMWFALLAQHNVSEHCCSTVAPETDLRKIRPSCRAQFDPILPSLAAFVWEHSRRVRAKASVRWRSGRSPTVGTFLG
ncbi:hypothetical protein QUB10_05090 [Microcoleus sp. B5-D4]|uniref:hypothetical protein n=1 Tax=unclassified Microcoleus TaxID=2642155 RepID=UPI002FCFEC46